MPTCEKCGKLFNCSHEDEKLIGMGHLASICNDCDQVPQPVAVPLQVVTSKKGPVPETVDDLACAELFLAELCDPAGLVRTFLRTPPPRVQRQAPLVRPKKLRIPVTVVSERSLIGTTTPAIRLQTNLLNFLNRKRDFWVRKVPDFSEDVTGISHIEVPRREVRAIQRISHEEVRVYRTDGWYVKLTFHVR
jgi:hypothetical protein